MGFIDTLLTGGASTLGNVANSGLGQVMGMLFGKANDRRQLNQNQALQNQQITGQEEVMKYNQTLQQQNWENTGAPAQVAQYEKAGLNPGLMYGGSGAGGATMGGGTASVSGGTAQQNPGDVMGVMSGMMNNQLVKAQTENIEADTENKKATNPNLGAENAGIQAKTNNTNADTKNKEQQLKESQQSYTDKMSEISSNAVKAQQEAQQSVNNTNISDATIKDKIQQIKEDAIGSAVQNALTRMQTKTETGKPALQKSEIDLNNEQVKGIIRQAVTDWEKVGIEQQNANTKGREAQNKIINNDVPESTRELTEIAEKVAQALVLKNLVSPGRNPIQGFKR